MTHPPVTHPAGGREPGQQRWLEPRRRLHPLSPLLHSAKALAVIVAALSVQGAVRLGLAAFLGLLIVVMCVATGFSAISWLVTGYQLVGRELRIHDGVLVRRTRAIPLERLQAVEVVRPLLARMFGLAELRLEVVGGGKTEAPLAFLTEADATALRTRLLALASRVGAPAGDPATPALSPGGRTALAPPAGGGPAPEVAPPGPAPPAEQHLHSVVNREILASQLRTPPVLSLPFAVVFVLAQYWFDRGAWSLVLLASMIVAVIGVIQQPVRRIMSYWNFRLALQQPAPGVRHAGLRLRHGLTETRSQTVPLHRVQALGVTWPLLWRGKGWLRARLDVAGYGSPEQGVTTSDQLLPVGDRATVRRLIAVVLPGVDLASLPLTTPPRRARVVAPLRRPVLGAGLTERVFVTRDGRVTREVVIVPYERIQSVRLVQGPLQRALGLATVYADTAGSLTAAAHHRELAEARQLAAELTGRARAARAGDQHRWHPAATATPEGGGATPAA